MVMTPFAIYEMTAAPAEDRDEWTTMIRAIEARRFDEAHGWAVSSLLDATPPPQ